MDDFYALIKNLKGVQIITGERVTDILTQDCNEEDILDSKVKYKTKIIGVKTEKNIYNCDKVILATGGKSYPLTGSTGDGYEIAKKLGHTVTEIRPSLVALTASRESLEICQHLQGLSLKNVAIKVLEKNNIIYEDFGEMLFTHFGVSGPIILSASAHLVRTKMEDVHILIDVKPALTEEKLDERIIRDFEKNKNREFKNSLNE